MRLFGVAGSAQTDGRGDQHSLEEGGGDFHRQFFLNIQMTFWCGKPTDSIKILKKKISRTAACGGSAHAACRARVAAVAWTWRKKVFDLVNDAFVLGRTSLGIFFLNILRFDCAAACRGDAHCGSNEHGFQKGGWNFHGFSF